MRFLALYLSCLYSCQTWNFGSEEFEDGFSLPRIEQVQNSPNLSPVMQTEMQAYMIVGGLSQLKVGSKATSKSYDRLGFFNSKWGMVMEVLQVGSSEVSRI